ncbi:MAG: 6-phosphofructokinase [Methanospirillum sp.]|nr:6-phosphofructokinase [Methanospirillum sp.]
MKTIGILTGGGDCPGINAVIRAVVRAGVKYDYETIGIRNGWQGLIDDDIEPLDNSLVLIHSWMNQDPCDNEES